MTTVQTQTQAQRERIDLTEDELRCEWCHEVIAPGMHYLKANIDVDTVHVVPVLRHIDMPPIIDAPFCCPLHLVHAITENGIFKDVFGR